MNPSFNNLRILALESRLSRAQPLRLACSNDDGTDASAAEKSEPRP